MIFVTVGTHHQPFQRLLGALTALDLAEVVLQYGPGEPPEGARQAEAYMPFDRMLECYAQAERVITHAGVGSILCARRAGHTPIVVPRRHDLGEHVDEHQAELSAALEQRGAVVAVREVEMLPAALAESPPRGDPLESPHTPLADAVRAALRGTPAQASRS